MKYIPQIFLTAVLLHGSPLFASDAGLDFFESKVRPLLIKHCYECHSEKEDKRKGGLVLDARAGWEMGGDSGPAIIPGEVEKSLLVEAVRHTDPDLAMPKEKLSDSEIAILEQWVQMGAPDPREGEVSVAHEIDLEEGRKFWAFQPITNPPIPAVQDEQWPASEIDHFVLARLEKEKLRPVSDAEARTLIRRASFDLIGLPPSPEEVETFVADTKKDPNSAFRNLVDRLLDSPHFGERWGRHWLDIARYAESTGVNWNLPYPVAWRYRDYVIDSFNADKPYDRFLHEQIAGDLLPAGNDEQRNEQLIATGFLAIGLKDLQALSTKIYEMDIVDEQIDCTSRAVLGLSIACARCHDHKFDPIRTEDYYALAGIFTSTEPMSGVKRLRKDELHGTRLQALAGTPDTMPEKLRDELIRSETAATKLSLNLKKTQRYLDKAKEDQDTAKIEELEAEVAELTVKQEAELATFLALNKKDHASLDSKAMTVRDQPEPTDCPVHIRGEADRTGDVVPRGVPAVFTRGESFPIAPGQSGRLELAHWMTEPSNPLTARVMANRIWQHLIGVGIVETVDNFGQNGQAPSHPAMLDFLAFRLMENDWSVKQIIREIMLSRVYRLDSAHDAVAHDLDPANRLCWRANRTRLDAEALRDAMLHVGGRLDLVPPDGSPVQATANNLMFYAQKGLFNPMVLNRASLAATEKERLESIGIKNTTGDFSNVSGLLLRDYRFRSIYLPSIRGGVTPVREVFDGAAPEEVVGRRAVTTVPTQALYMMNNPFAIESAQALARRVSAKATGSDERIRLAFQLALGRPPTADEIEQTTGFLADYAALPSKKDTEADSVPVSDPAWTVFCQTLLASAEFRYRY